MAERTRSDQATRRRFARRQWSGRLQRWRLVLALLLVVLLAGFAVYAVYFSPWLRAEAVEVVGLHQLREQQVLARADVPLDEPLAREDLGAITRRVEALAIVKSADVSRSWPHKVRIEVTERTPVAVLRGPHGFVQVDAAGVRFLPALHAPGGLPTIDVGAQANADALAEGAKVAASLPSSVARLVDHIDVATIDKITLSLRGGRSVLWGSAEDSATKAQVVLDLLKRHARSIDVSVPSLPTTR